MCHAGTGIQESQRLCICQYHVHWKYPKWHRCLVCILQNKGQEHTVQISVLLGDHPAIRNRCRCGRSLHPYIWYEDHLVLLLSAVRKLSVHVHQGRERVKMSLRGSSLRCRRMKGASRGVCVEYIFYVMFYIHYIFLHLLILLANHSIYFFLFQLRLAILYKCFIF